jgi:hypothetical protein
LARRRPDSLSHLLIAPMGLLFVSMFNGNFGVVNDLLAGA